MSSYKLIIKNGILVDPANNVHGIFDIAIDHNGKIVRVESEINGPALEIFDAEGLVVAPGVIDCHMHASSTYGGPLAHRMLAKAGVVTAIELGGPVEDTIPLALKHGCGLNVAFMQTVKPGETISGPSPDRNEIESLLDKTLASGGVGFKVLGGHFPLTPEATEMVFSIANDRGAYMAFHAGSLASGSNLDGFKEAVELAAGKRLHLAHINSYCRGAIMPAEQEAEEALSILEQNPNVQSESYLARINGLSGVCVDGCPESTGTQAALKLKGFDTTEEGMREAIKAGWCQVNAPVGGEIVQLPSVEGLDFWEGQQRQGLPSAVSFAVNPPTTRLRLASARRKDGSFVINAISTDGGGIPRNDQVEKGLALVRAGVFTLDEFIHKVTAAPARMLGLTGKGHLAEGADADVSVLCLDSLRPVLTLGMGQVIMNNGLVTGAGTNILTTTKGPDHIRKQNHANLQNFDLAERPFLRPTA
ncbi:amidohydrolase family protein [Maridesulfovibrio sp.]|uniref:amidohydrolase family protein n=1 Tax=Maridesulfovibrio sp. TaxID=2795000 RepID=UPI003AFFB93C